jgi:hypothetical protein
MEDIKNYKDYVDISLNDINFKIAFKDKSLSSTRVNRREVKNLIKALKNTFL